jgi:hypothetical protein
MLFADVLFIIADRKKSMKKISILILTAFFWSCFAFLPVPLQADSNASLSLNGHYSRRLSGYIGHNNGLGGSLLLEYLPVETFSIGAGLSLTQYFGFSAPGTSQVESVDLVSRILFNPGESWTFYLMLGGGLNPKIDLQGDYLWGGDYHLLAGLGVWCPLSTQWALDFGAAYNYYNFPGDPLQAVQAKLGLGYFFNPAFKQLQASAPALSPAQSAVSNGPAPSPAKEPAAAPVETPTATPLSVTSVVAAKPAPTAVPTSVVSQPALSQPNGPKTVPTATPAPAVAPAPAVTVVSAAASVPTSVPTAAAKSGLLRELTAPKGYSLWEISGMPEVYGDPELYPLLVDANRKIMKPTKISVEAGKKLKVPRDLTQGMIQKARINAWKAKYIQFRGRGLTREAYQKWRKAHMPTIQ